MWAAEVGGALLLSFLTQASSFRNNKMTGEMKMFHN